MSGPTGSWKLISRPRPKRILHPGRRVLHSGTLKPSCHENRALRITWSKRKTHVKSKPCENMWPKIAANILVVEFHGSHFSHPIILVSHFSSDIASCLFLCLHFFLAAVKASALTVNCSLLNIQAQRPAENSLTTTFIEVM